MYSSFSNDKNCINDFLGIRSCIRDNEEYTDCMTCGRNCLDLKRPTICKRHLCRPGCDCKPGFYRNSKGDCVNRRQCGE